MPFFSPEAATDVPKGPSIIDGSRFSQNRYQTALPASFIAAYNAFLSMDASA